MMVALLGPSADLVRCESVRDRLREHGIVLAYDWVVQIRRDRDHGRTDADLTMAERVSARWRCTDGIRVASFALWLTGGSEGAAYEAGYAACLSVPIVVAGPSPHAIYGVTEERIFADDDAAIAWLAMRAGRSA